MTASAEIFDTYSVIDPSAEPGSPPRRIPLEVLGYALEDCGLFVVDDQDIVNQHPDGVSKTEFAALVEKLRAEGPSDEELRNAISDLFISAAHCSGNNLTPTRKQRKKGEGEEEVHDGSPKVSREALGVSLASSGASYDGCYVGEGLTSDEIHVVLSSTFSKAPEGQKIGPKEFAGILSDRLVNRRDSLTKAQLEKQRQARDAVIDEEAAARGSLLTLDSCDDNDNDAADVQRCNNTATCLAEALREMLRELELEWARLTEKRKEEEAAKAAAEAAAEEKQQREAAERERQKRQEEAEAAARLQPQQSVCDDELAQSTAAIVNNEDAEKNQCAEVEGSERRDHNATLLAKSTKSENASDDKKNGPSAPEEKKKKDEGGCCLLQ